MAQGELFIHGTTHAINAILTGNTARTAFLTTEGHPDTLVIREGGRSDIFNFATPYPGSEWYYAYKDSILEQYDGDLEKFILALGDATSITAVISHEFTAMDLMGLQQIVATRDMRLLEQAEKHRAALKEPVASPQVSFNFEATKLKAPVEPTVRKRIRVAA